MNFGVVAIGRNEGERLRWCLKSVPAGIAVVYVDSGSTDGSAQWARDRGTDVIELDMNVAFTAARARNAGFRRLKELAPGLLYVQFVDGDCKLEENWLDHAASFLKSHDNVGVVCGRRRERFPEKSVYNWLCDREWERPTGEVQACGGDAMMRISAFEAVGGYRDDLIAGEEPELCVRLRGAGWRIFQLERPMTLHDAAMTRIGQWWRRNQRSGYAFAQGAYLHGRCPNGIVSGNRAAPGYGGYGYRWPASWPDWHLVHGVGQRSSSIHCKCCGKSCETAARWPIVRGWHCSRCSHASPRLRARSSLCATDCSAADRV